MTTKDQILKRIKIAYLFIVLFAVVVVLRVLYLQFVEKNIWVQKQAKITKVKERIIPVRGDIYSDDNRLLVSSVPVYTLRMDLMANGLTDKVFNQNIDSLAYYLSNLFKDKSKEFYKIKLIKARQKHKRYLLIKRDVSFTQIKKLKRFPIFRLGKYKGGLIIEQKNRRVKPFGILASRTLGYTLDNGSSIGLERAYNSYLQGREGVKWKQKLSGGVKMDIKGGTIIEPEEGKDIVTTINIEIQDIAENALLRQLEYNEADHGCVVVMEVKTGEIKAIANLKRNKNGSYSESYNYAIGESVEPGSTFKLPSLIVALEDGYISLSDSIQTGRGYVEYYGKKLRDSHAEGYGKITVKQVFEKSSNVGVSKIITKFYSENPSRFVDRLYQMNLNDKLGINFLGEGSPRIIDPDDSLWSGITLPWMSVGYSIQFTPLQILNFYNAVANNGKMIKPKFVKEVKYRGEVIKKFKTEIINPSICSKQTINAAKEMLIGVVDEGTAEGIKNQYYKIAGKTGTAQIADRKHGYNKNKKKYRASFVGYFPANNPKYSCIVVVHDPKKNGYYGSQVAAPVFKEIANNIFVSDKEMSAQKDTMLLLANNVPYSKNGFKDDLINIFDYLNIDVKTNNIKTKWVKTIKKDSVVQLYNNYQFKNLVPNVKGMGLKDALFLLENAGLKVSVIGKGTVVYQSIDAGKRFNKGDKIILKLVE